MRRPPRARCTDTLLPYTTLVRAGPRNLARWAQGMGARLADSLDQPVWRQYLRQDLRRLAGLIIKVERHPAAAMPGEEAADRRVILRPVADEDRDRKSTRLNSSH